MPCTKKKGREEQLEHGALTGATTRRKVLKEIERLQSLEPEGGARN